MNNIDLQKHNATVNRNLVANTARFFNMTANHIKALILNIDEFNINNLTVNDLNAQKVYVDESKLVNHQDERLLDSNFILTRLNALNSITRILNSKLYDIISVKDFGAVGDGVTDDTKAIQDAFNYTGALYFPPGTYICNDTIDSTNQPVNIVGAGNNVSVIQFSNVARGFNISLTKPSTVCVYNIIIRTTGNWTGTALYVNFVWLSTETANQVNLSYFYMRNVLIDSEDIPLGGDPVDYNHGWGNGVHLVNAWETTVIDCFFSGRKSSTLPIQAQSAFIIDGVFIHADFHFQTTTFKGWSVGVDVPKDNFAIGIEGLFVNECVFNNMKKCVRWLSPTARPLLLFNNNTCEAFVRVLELSILQQILICNNNMKLVTDPGDTNAPSTGIYLDAVLLCTVHNNIITSAVTDVIQNPVLINLNNTSAQPYAIQSTSIHNNTFVVTDSTLPVQYSIQFSTPSDLCDVRENLHVNFADSGSGTYDIALTTTSLIVGNPLCTRYLSGNIVTAGDTTIIPFDESEFQTSLIGSGGNPTNSLQIPVGTGYRRCQVTAGIGFSTQAGGIRLLTILKNGLSNYIGVGNSFIGSDQNASPVTPTMTVTTSVVDVVEGDYFQLQFFQDSGSPITEYSTQTWMNIEIIT